MNVFSEYVSEEHKENLTELKYKTIDIINEYLLKIQKTKMKKCTSCGAFKVEDRFKLCSSCHQVEKEYKEWY